MRKEKMGSGKTSPVRCVGYLRVSTEEQKEGFSLKMQKEKLQAFATSQDYLLLKLYEDVDSGQKMERKGLKLMLKELEGVVVNLILVYKLDRLSRRLKDILVVISEELEPKEIGLRSVTENFDTVSPEGRLMLQLLGSFAEFEGRRIGQRLKDGRLEASKTRYAGGGICYGYVLKEGKLFVEEKEAEVIKRIKRLRKAQHLTPSAIARILKEEKVPTRNGGRWTDVQVSTILNRSVYRTGQYRYGSVVHSVPKIA